MELKTVIFSAEHGGTFKWTGYKERNRNVNTPFYSNPYIHCPYKPSKYSDKSRNGAATSFRTQSQVNDILRDLVTPKNQMMTTYNFESGKAWQSNFKKAFSENKPIMTCPNTMIKTNYHFPGKLYDTVNESVKRNAKIKAKNYMAQNLPPSYQPRSTFTSLGFQGANRQAKPKSKLYFIFIE